MNTRGFTLIELLIVVVIIGILAAIAIPKFANTKEKAVLASMKSDLRNLITAQEAFFFDNTDYAGSVTPGAQINATGGVGSATFVPSTGNVLLITYISATGYNATITNPVLIGAITTCGIFVGPVANSPNGAAVPNETVVGCW
ncbi:MAG: prepilin-type N-terminal cleavage/methylation domain-containing protein [Gemmatimonadota bacterium]|nr:prepilin-type N-terminal cleavage/methylation domain-containing protein [Gemmatimonadota bacterium]